MHRPSRYVIITFTLLLVATLLLAGVTGQRLADATAPVEPRVSARVDQPLHTRPHDVRIEEAKPAIAVIVPVPSPPPVTTTTALPQIAEPLVIERPTPPPPPPDTMTRCRTAVEVVNLTPHEGWGPIACKPHGTLVRYDGAVYNGYVGSDGGEVVISPNPDLSDAQIRWVVRHEVGHTYCVGDANDKTEECADAWAAAHGGFE